MAAEPGGLRLAVFKVSYVAGDGAERQVPLAEAAPVPFEQALPVAGLPLTGGSGI